MVPDVFSYGGKRLTLGVILSDKTTSMLLERKLHVQLLAFGICPEEKAQEQLDSPRNPSSSYPSLLNPLAQAPSSSSAQVALQPPQPLCTQTVSSYEGKQVPGSCCFTALHFLQQLSVSSSATAYGDLFLGYFVVAAAGNLPVWRNSYWKEGNGQLSSVGQICFLFLFLPSPVWKFKRNAFYIIYCCRGNCLLFPDH